MDALVLPLVFIGFTCFGFVVGYIIGFDRGSRNV